TPAAPKPITGEHFVKLADAQMVQTGRSEYLELTLEIADGPHRGLRILDRVHLHDPDVVVQQNALARLAAYCFATGQVQWQGQTERLASPSYPALSQSNGAHYINAISRSDKQASSNWRKELVELLDWRPRSKRSRASTAYSSFSSMPTHCLPSSLQTTPV